MSITINDLLEPENQSNKENYAIEDLLFQVQSLKEQNQQRDNVIEHLRSCQEVKQSSLSQIISQGFDNVHIQTEIAGFQVKINNLKTDLTDKTVENSNIQMKLISLASENQILKETKVRQTYALERMENDLMDFSKYKERTKLILEEYILTSESLENKLKQFKIRLQEKDIVISFLKLKEKEEISVASNAEMSVNDNKISILDRKMDALNYKIGSLKTQIEMYKRQISSLDCEKKLSRATILRLSKDLERLSKSKNDVESKFFVEINKEMPDNKTDCTEETEKLRCLEVQVRELTSLLADALQDNTDKSERIAELMETSPILGSIKEKLEGFDNYILHKEDFQEEIKKRDFKKIDKFLTNVHDLKTLIREIRNLN